MLLEHQDIQVGNTSESDSHCPFLLHCTMGRIGLRLVQCEREVWVHALYLKLLWLVAWRDPVQPIERRSHFFPRLSPLPGTTKETTGKFEGLQGTVLLSLSLSLALSLPMTLSLLVSLLPSPTDAITVIVNVTPTIPATVLVALTVSVTVSFTEPTQAMY